MSEANLSHKLMRALRAVGHAERMENMAANGTPDVNYCIQGVEGWVENKYLRFKPARADTPIVLPHYTKEQRNWHKDRRRAGGRVYVLLHIGDAGHVLLDARWAATHLGMATLATVWSAGLVAVHGPSFPTGPILAQLRQPAMP